MKYELYPPLGLISSDLFGQETPAEENAPAEQMSPEATSWIWKCPLS